MEWFEWYEGNLKNRYKSVDSSWDNEIEHFFNAIESGSKIKMGNTTDALNLMHHIDEIYKSDNRKLKNALDLNIDL